MGYCFKIFQFYNEIEMHMYVTYNNNKTRVTIHPGFRGTVPDLGPLSHFKNAVPHAPEL